VTTEEVPAQGDRQTTMRYYWEGSHFRSEAGDLVLDRLFGWREAGREVPADFGVRLRSANVEAHLDETRRLRDAYRRTHASDLVDLRRMALELPFLKR